MMLRALSSGASHAAPSDDDRLVIGIRIPAHIEQPGLIGDVDALHMIGIDKTVDDRVVAPVAAPDQPVILCKVFQEAEIALPAGFAVDVLHQIASQPKMVNPDIPQLRGALVEQLGLTLLAAIGFEHHQLDALARGTEDDLLHRGARDRFQQIQISDALRRCKEGVRPNNVGVKTHALLPNTPGVLLNPLYASTKRIAEDRKSTRLNSSH